MLGLDFDLLCDLIWILVDCFLGLGVLGLMGLVACYFGCVVDGGLLV